MGKVIFYIYRLIYFLLRFTLPPLASVFNEKIRIGVQLRQKSWTFPENLRTSPNNRFWFHCSSGEFEYAKPIIRTLKKEYPQSTIIVTYFSPSYRENIQQSIDVDYSYPLPWDQPKPIQAFLKKTNPSRLIIIKTDLWPELIYQVHRQKIPLFLVAANFYQHTKITNRIFRPLYRFLLSHFKHISCISSEDQKILHKISPQTSSSCDGDPRYEQVFHRLQTSSLIKIALKKNIQRSKTFIMGSTWPQDDKELFIAMEKLRSKDSGFSFILVPHELNTNKLLYLCDKLTELNFTVRFYSETSVWHPGEILLVDQRGLLAQLYTWAAYAFVGGSFKKSIHSVMEPLSVGCLTFVGPYNYNNREAQLFKKYHLTAPSSHQDSDRENSSISPVIEVKDGSAIYENIITLQKSPVPEEVDHISEEIISFVKKNLGASQKILESIA